MENEYRRKENFEQAYEDLDEEDKKELTEIGKELKKIQDKNKNPNLSINDKELKKRIAKICSKLIEETPNDKTSIMETSYIITGSFIGCNYGDKLDEAIEIAGELELPEHHVTGDVLQMWEEMKKKFQQYLS
jgi:F0F1-type ATP synthase alpha subunit